MLFHWTTHEDRSQTTHTSVIPLDYSRGSILDHPHEWYTTGLLTSINLRPPTRVLFHWTTHEDRSQTTHTSVIPLDYSRASILDHSHKCYSTGLLTRIDLRPLTQVLFHWTTHKDRSQTTHTSVIPLNYSWGSILDHPHKWYTTELLTSINLRPPTWVLFHWTTHKDRSQTTHTSVIPLDYSRGSILDHPHEWYTTELLTSINLRPPTWVLFHWTTHKDRSQTAHMSVIPLDYSQGSISDPPHEWYTTGLLIKINFKSPTRVVYHWTTLHRKRSSSNVWTSLSSTPSHS